ncbi:uncharacterized protein [Diabrotica undecimpunctata]|uniref:uncharacterized protein n=1 Tax=Diabrotica undecimpunctata TaxID=50387 RepID=UPI003B634339
MTSRGKFLVQMCLDEGEASTSHENNAELWSSKSTSQHIPILSAGTSTTEGSFNTTLMQGCSTTTSDNEKENTKHCEEHNSSIEVSNIPGHLRLRKWSLIVVQIFLPAVVITIFRVMMMVYQMLNQLIVMYPDQNKNVVGEELTLPDGKEILKRKIECQVCLTNQF